MHCSLESNEEGTKTHVSHVVLKVPSHFCWALSKNRIILHYTTIKMSVHPHVGERGLSWL